MFFPNDFKYEHDIMRRGLYGLLLGDTVGCSYEFKSVWEETKFLKIDMVPPIGFNSTYSHVPIRTWTDYGAQALALLDILCQHTEFQWI